jgi:hypothetical protein
MFRSGQRLVFVNGVASKDWKLPLLSCEVVSRAILTAQQSDFKLRRFIEAAVTLSMPEVSLLWNPLLPVRVS